MKITTIAFSLLSIFGAIYTAKLRNNVETESDPVRSYAGLCTQPLVAGTTQKFNGKKGKCEVFSSA
jgi:hypothetical protein